MAVVIYGVKENDPNGGTLSQIDLKTWSTGDGAKEKKFYEEKIAGAMPFVRPVSSKKSNWKNIYLFLMFFMAIY